MYDELGSSVAEPANRRIYDVLRTTLLVNLRFVPKPDRMFDRNHVAVPFADRVF